MQQSTTPTATLASTAPEAAHKLRLMAAVIAAMFVVSSGSKSTSNNNTN